MKHLEQFIVQTGRQPSAWTSRDIQNYMDYVRAQMTNGSGGKNPAACPPGSSAHGGGASIPAAEAVYARE